MLLLVILELFTFFQLWLNGLLFGLFTSLNVLDAHTLEDE